MIEWLPHVNVTLNSLATVLLIAGFVLIKRKQEKAHRAVMLAALAVSALFLASYLTYHFNIEGGSKKFPTDTSIAPLAARYFYYGLLLTHVVLAMAVPFLALGSVYLGMTDRRAAHKRLSKWTWPIWLYVSVTGVLVYLMLYQLYLPPNAGP
ncbi:MAG: DUF420 domain-containing protein [bacterium]|nr:DUF420 domain-containing protein [bacterium]